MEWFVTPYGNQEPLLIGTCFIEYGTRCETTMANYYYVLMHGQHTSELIIKQHHLDAATVMCSESVWNGERYVKSSRFCKISARYPADKVRNCRVQFNVDMTVSGSCEVDTISIDDLPYVCFWQHVPSWDLKTALHWGKHGGFNCTFTSRYRVHSAGGNWGFFRLSVYSGHGWMVAMDIPVDPPDFTTMIEGAEDGILTAQENTPFTITCTATRGNRKIRPGQISLSCEGTETKEVGNFSPANDVWGKTFSITPKYTTHNGIVCKCHVAVWTSNVVSFGKETYVTVMEEQDPKTPKTTPPSVTPLTTSKGTWRSTTSSPTDNSKGTTTTTNTDHDDDDNDDDSLPIAVIAGGGGGGLIIIIVVIVVIDIVVKRRRDSQETYARTVHVRGDDHAYAVAFFRPQAINRDPQENNPRAADMREDDDGYVVM
ncbi:uncharacterized protein LOC143281035 [Babylonia areolata]|uniref:uncharacterized protein LOC143281035 n=1 Tax=Babylonia areolata TaxID=304850 RepID=UPI003FD12AD3